MSWIGLNLGWLSGVFALAASIFLFIPLIDLVAQSRDFRALQDLLKKGAMSGEDIEEARKLIIQQRFSDGQSLWLWLAGICLVLTFACLAASLPV
ncbi:hypothetical protein L2U69_04985 [Zavarzinia compransoris]|uniref:hypothetical protein n=1 Tax=Zavarzinia marina TaxID=2911065 RepID=UPI001F3EAF97|nr:hypothetical protein [Zavarzinia marina]MCF4164992.1 hypothetical protein [Zavarzinia marina]